MSNDYTNMTPEAMKVKASDLISSVTKIEVPQDVQDLIQAECDKAFAKSDGCPMGTDIVFMPDLSSSMNPNGKRGWAWHTQESFIRGVVPKAMGYDDGGVDIWPIRSATELEKSADPTKERLLEVTDPEKALEYVRSFEKKLTTTPTRNLFAARMADVVKNAISDPYNTKRTLFLISTDGQPDPEGPSMESTTEDAIIALHNKGLDPRRYIAISYIIITSDFHTMCGYLKLEDRNTWGPDGKIECDVANAIFPALIMSLGGFESPLAIHIALGGAIRPEIDSALENIVSGPAKDLMMLMQASIDAGYHTETL
ncbi:hypothetical protein PGQ11_010244 [Apiospora arundinis]|uniref:VWFA domain-containing protein n=1 Tax=Apiospora arundinis TaxID=335852 RepID=A0ABR2I994_9PEZI